MPGDSASPGDPGGAASPGGAAGPGGAGGAASPDGAARTGGTANPGDSASPDGTADPGGAASPGGTASAGALAPGTSSAGSRSAGERRGRRRRTVPVPEHLERSDGWHGLRPGDPVEIDGVAGRGLTWVFRAYVRNTNNGSEAVEVLGGRPGQQHVRSFRPEQVFPVGGRKRGVPSLDEAPQLPLA